MAKPNSYIVMLFWVLNASKMVHAWKWLEGNTLWW